jgi:hypothetical protein
LPCPASTFRACFQKFVARFGETRTDVITIDGKTPAELPERMVLDLLCTSRALGVVPSWRRSLSASPNNLNFDTIRYRLIIICLTSPPSRRI